MLVLKSYLLLAWVVGKTTITLRGRGRTTRTHVGLNPTVIVQHLRDTRDILDNLSHFYKRSCATHDTFFYFLAFSEYASRTKKAPFTII